MELALDLVRRNFSLSRDQLYVGELPVSEIIREFGTPLFIYDEGSLESRLNALRSILPPSFRISYSVKANPTQAILKFFVSHDCGLEIASGGELIQALAAGCPPNRIIFAGPGKTVAELDLALQHEIKEIHVESQLEMRRLAELCRERACRAQIAVRVNPSGEAQGGAMRMGGKPAPFGVDEESLDSVVQEIVQNRWLSLTGIHLFAGTQILDHNILISQYQKAAQIAARLAAKFDCKILTVDFGGGLGIPYFPGDKPLELERLGEELRHFALQTQEDPIFSATEFMLEPGRFLVGEAGVYVTRVNDIKTSRGRKFLILDGGMHHHLAASGNLGQTIKRNYPVALLNKLSARPTETVDVVGPLCTPLDTLARNVNLPAAEVGDLFGIFQSGAYARSASPTTFLSHPAPAEVLVSDKSASLIRARGRLSDYLKDQPAEVMQNSF